MPWSAYSSASSRSKRCCALPIRSTATISSRVAAAAAPSPSRSCASASSARFSGEGVSRTARSAAARASAQRPPRRRSARGRSARARRRESARARSPPPARGVAVTAVERELAEPHVKPRAALVGDAVDRVGACGRRAPAARARAADRRSARRAARRRRRRRRLPGPTRASSARRAARSRPARCGATLRSPRSDGSRGRVALRARTVASASRKRCSVSCADASALQRRDVALGLQAQRTLRRRLRAQHVADVARSR